ncbi:uncharacterized protein PGTG_16069 [Puccinia graminis f. sp. tritici CRL 75-36-700-3]|uniref:Uncharacterized protein n=1 Tax=Puccinia graminis f. sp. tritici (strain CRL 75-36-700-3 / race SCCL) TaxID=418459 RepID=E3L1Q7_PUCGT|nr:uncharacterized protein PGTG_16069 [Puccinia graminis f. sp. tritici CRL 75-36-700-3]EFP90482.2 hypothetical protein PGTG_16069 [Puccinia graminis f. sp. tritici CRL 75-36-700-3]
MTRIRLTFLGLVLCYSNVVITMAGEGMTSLSHPPAHDMDQWMSDHLDDITDCNLLVPSNKPRLSDEHTHSINLDSDNPNSNEFIEGYSSDLFHSPESPRSDSSSSYSVGSEFRDKDMHEAVNSYQPSVAMVKEGGQAQELKVADQQADQHESLSSVKSKPRSQRQTGSDSAPATWGSRGQLMEGPLPDQGQELESPDNLKNDVVLLQKAQRATRKRKTPVQASTGVPYSAMDDGKLTDKLVIYARKLSESQSAEDREAFRIVQAQIAAEREKLIELQRLQVTDASREQLDNKIVQEPDSELTERQIFIFRNPPPDSDSVSIRLLRDNRTKGAIYVGERLVTRVDKVAQFLDIFDHLFSRLALNNNERGIRPAQAGDHREVLDRFYNLIFTETMEHPPLMGSAKRSSLAGEQPKKFSPAQMSLYKVLTQRPELTNAQAAAVALKFRQEFDKPMSPIGAMPLHELVAKASSLDPSLEPVKKVKKKEPVS